jgi:IclR family transcriptional regulator, KDG regulon repressor
MKATIGNKYPVKSVVKTLTILEHLGNSPSGTSLTEISSKLRIGKSTVHRLLATLRDHDFVWLEPQSSRYILGARILQLSEQLNHQSILIRHGEPMLAKLARATGETCNLGVLDRRSVLYLIMKESKNPLRMTGQVGKRLPAHCTALGKALLTGLTKDELSDLYGKTEKLETFTANSVSTVPELLQRVEKARHSGLVFDNEEIYSGVMCLGTPIRDHSNRVVAAISVSFPKTRVDAKTMEHFKTLLLEAAGDLSRQLGFIKPAVAEAGR